MKKSLAILVTTILLFSNVTAFAWQEIDVQTNSVKVIVDGNMIDSNNFVYNGVTYLPMRDIAEALKAKVSYDEATKTANIKTETVGNTSGADLDKDKLKELLELADIYSSVEYNLKNSEDIFIKSLDMISEINDGDHDKNKMKVKINDMRNNGIIPLREYAINLQTTINKVLDSDITYKDKLSKAKTGVENLIKYCDMLGMMCTEMENFNAMQSDEAFYNYLDMMKELNKDMSATILDCSLEFLQYFREAQDLVK